MILNLISKKVFIILLNCIACVILSGCGADIDQENNAPPQLIEEPQSKLPFSTLEPENFTLKAVISSAGKMEEVLIARRAGDALISRNVGTPRNFTIIKGETSFIVYASKSIFAEITSDITKQFEHDEITSLLLAKKEYAAIQLISNDKEFSRYLIKLRNSNINEFEITIDNMSGLPKKYEIFNTEGESRISLFLIELTEIKTEATEQLFKVPENYKKVSIESLRDQITNNE